MEEVYRNIWSGYGCVGSTLGVAAIGLAIVLAVVGFIWLLSRPAIARIEQQHGAGSSRGLGILFATILAVLTGVVLYAVLDGTTLHRAQFGPAEIRLDYCDGPVARTERFAPDEVARIDYRVVRRRGRSGTTFEDLAVLTHRSGAEHTMPLRVDAEVSRPDALVRHLPPAVIAAWDAGLRARGAAPLPAAYRR